MIRFKIFKKFPDLIYKLSTKQQGSMKVTKNSKENKLVLKNRQGFLSRFSLREHFIVKAKLDHSGLVKVVNQKSCGKWIKNIDGLICGNKNLYLSLTVADCFPVFFFDPEKKIIGLAHASWRAISRDLIARMVGAMKNRFFCLPKNILVGIGPGIRKCHFEVQKDVASKFSQNFLIKRKKRLFIDLPLAIKTELIKNGLLPQNIEELKECTYCLRNKYFSYRREKPRELKVMMVIIGLKKEN